VIDAVLDVRPAEVATVGVGGQSALAHGLARSQRHLGELPVVGPDIGHLVRDDEVVLGIHGSLDVVAHKTRPFGLRDHRARVGVGQRELRVGLSCQALLDAIHPTHLFAQCLDLLLQALGLGLDLGRLGAVCGLQRV